MPNSGSDFRAADRHGRGSVESFKRSFFDREAVQKAVDRAVAKQMSRFGAFTRQRARTSIRYREKPSAPGQPPSAHRTMVRLRPAKKGSPPGTPGKKQLSSPLRDFLFFGYERSEQTVVIGPAKTNQTSGAKPVAGTIPEVEEEGGQITVTEVRKNGRWVRADMRSRRRLAGRPMRTRTITIAPRPYMRPAFEAELPKFMESLKDSATPT